MALICNGCGTEAPDGARGWKTISEKGDYPYTYTSCDDPACKERVTVLICKHLLNVPTPEARRSVA